MWNFKTNSKWKRIILILAFLTCLGSILIGCYWSEKKTQDESAFYTQAIDLATTDVSKSFDLCSKTDKMKNECLTEITKIISTNDVRRGISICEGIAETAWRDECLFNVASSSVYNISLVIEICEMSKLFKHDCYTRSTVALANFLQNISSVVLVCHKVPIESRNSCFFGLGSFFGNHFSKNINSAVSACNDIPIEFRDDCFFGLANSFRRFGSDVSSIMLACNKIPIEFRNYCSQDAGSSFSQLFGYDINSAISACKEFPVELRDACLRSLSWDKGRIGDVSLCNKFEKPYSFICFLGFGSREGSFFEGTDGCSSIIDENFKSWCYRGFGRGLGGRFSGNISLAFDVCNSSLSEEYKFDCYKGVSEGVGNFFSETNSVFVLEQCSSLGKLSPYCFERVGRKIVRLYSYNLSEAFNTCYRMNKSFGDSCFVGVGKGLGEIFLSNLSLALMKCEELSVPYSTNCNQGLEEVIKFYNTSL